MPAHPHHMVGFTILGHLSQPTLTVILCRGNVGEGQQLPAAGCLCPCALWSPWRLCVMRLSLRVRVEAVLSWHPPDIYMCLSATAVQVNVRSPCV